MRLGQKKVLRRRIPPNSGSRKKKGQAAPQTKWGLATVEGSTGQEKSRRLHGARSTKLKITLKEHSHKVKSQQHEDQAALLKTERRTGDCKDQQRGLQKTAYQRERKRAEGTISEGSQSQ